MTETTSRTSTPTIHVDQGDLSDSRIRPSCRCSGNDARCSSALPSLVPSRSAAVSAWLRLHYKRFADALGRGHARRAVAAGVARNEHQGDVVAGGAARRTRRRRRAGPGGAARPGRPRSSSGPARGGHPRRSARPVAYVGQARRLEAGARRPGQVDVVGGQGRSSTSSVTPSAGFANSMRPFRYRRGEPRWARVARRGEATVPLRASTEAMQTVTKSCVRGHREQCVVDVAQASPGRRGQRCTATMARMTYLATIARAARPDALARTSRASTTSWDRPRTEEVDEIAAEPVDLAWLERRRRRRVR